MVYTRDRVQGLRRRSNRAHETPMRSRRFVALFGGRTADGSGELRGDEKRGKGTVVAIVEADVGRRDGTARICARNLAGNNKGQQPAGSASWRERGTTVVLNLALRGAQQRARAAKWSSPGAFSDHSAARTIRTGEIIPR